MGQILGQGPQCQPDASLFLGLLLMPQLVKRKKRRRRTKMKMRKKWQLGGFPLDGVSWEQPSDLALPVLLIEKPAHSAAAEP